MTNEQKPARKYWYSNVEFYQLSDEEREKLSKPYQEPPKNLLVQLLENQNQILHELSEIRADLMYLQVKKNE